MSLGQSARQRLLYSLMISIAEHGIPILVISTSRTISLKANSNSWGMFSPLGNCVATFLSSEVIFSLQISQCVFLLFEVWILYVRRFLPLCSRGYLVLQ